MERGLRLTILACILMLIACQRAPGTPLGAAAAAGDTANVRRMLASGEDPDGLDRAGLGPLHHAARAGQVAAILALVEGGAAVDLEDEAANAWTPLMHAIHKRQGGAALALLNAGARVEARSSGKATPLFMAAGYGEVEVVRALLERGADPRTRVHGSMTALWSAAGGGSLADITDGPPLGSCSPEVVRLLLERAPDLRLERNAWTRAVSWLASSPECVELTRRLQEG